ncbi:MAG: hypothetical protein QOF37_2412 [Thermoleophilaceae bacterium]|nr:hypothetical protein [Thermoleophilaceae bacterium]
MTTAYDMLADLAEQELELVTAGAIDELQPLHSHRDTLIATLPPRPPAEARGALERAAVVQARVTAALEMHRRDLTTELARLGQGRTMIRGYMPPAKPQRGRVDRSG